MNRNIILKTKVEIVQMYFVTPFTRSPDTKTNGNTNPAILLPENDGEDELFG